MSKCFKCGKGKQVSSYSRHKKGSSGASGTWALRAPIHKRVQKPNLHTFKGEAYCTKCVRIVKAAFPVQKEIESKSVQPETALVSPA